MERVEIEHFIENDEENACIHELSWNADVGDRRECFSEYTVKCEKLRETILVRVYS